MTTKLLWEMEDVKKITLAMAELVRAEENCANIFEACSKAYEWLETKDDCDLFCSMLTDKEFVSNLKG